MKVILSTITVLIIIGLGVFAYSSMKPKATVIQDKNESMKTEDKKMASRYIEYSSANLDNAKKSRRVLFFYANWCPTCRPADTNFSQNESKIPEDVTLIRVNYNDTDTDQQEKDLAAKYGVTYQHTFVQIDEHGNAVTKWNGGQITELLQNIKSK